MYVPVFICSVVPSLIFLFQALVSFTVSDVVSLLPPVMWRSVDFGHSSLVVEPVFGHQGGHG